MFNYNTIALISHATKGTCHAKTGSIKDRNGMDLAEDIKKRWQEYTEELYKTDLHDQIITMVWSLTLT